MNRVNGEFLAIMNIRHLQGAALTPRHPSLCERNHQVVMADLLVLMQAVVTAYPQEWAALIPVVEYVLHTAPQGPDGLSVMDMTSAHAIIRDTDSRLVMFRVPRGLPETDWGSRIISNVRGVYGTFTRCNREKALCDTEAVNKHAIVWQFDSGETVFRKLPHTARPPKHRFPPPTFSPYMVESQPDPFNLILREPQSQSLVDHGARIPLNQIMAGSRRARLHFEQENDLHSVPEMIESKRNPDGRCTKH